MRDKLELVDSSKLFQSLIGGCVRSSSGGCVRERARWGGFYFESNLRLVSAVRMRNETNNPSEHNVYQLRLDGLGISALWCTFVPCCNVGAEGGREGFLID